jgi:hypothetical protein
MSRTRRNNPRNIKNAERIERDVVTQNWAASSVSMLLRRAKHLRNGQVGSCCHWPSGNSPKGYDTWTTTASSHKRWAKRESSQARRRQGQKLISENLDE